MSLKNSLMSGSFYLTFSPVDIVGFFDNREHASFVPGHSFYKDPFSARRDERCP